MKDNELKKNSINFEEDSKKHASHAWDCMILILALLVTGTAGCCFGYTRGQDIIWQEAVDKGYAEQTEDGNAWKSKRAIEIGE